jgi:hypothetical protein
MCLAARFMVEMDKIRTQGKQFFKHAGNVVDLSVSCCIIFTVVLRLVAYAHIVYDSSKWVFELMIINLIFNFRECEYADFKSNHLLPSMLQSHLTLS